jgi:hypothetical protein
MKYFIRKVEMMKIKNIYRVLIAFALSFAFSGVYAKAFKPAQTNLSLSTEFSDILGDETPLEFSTKNLQAYFKGLNLAPGQQSIKMRVAPKDSKVVEFNKSFLSYIKKVYNNKSYSTVLSQDGTHIIDFIDLCNELQLGCGSAYVGLRLFYNKIKACEVIDDSVLIQLLEKLPKMLAPYFSETTKTKKQDLSFIKNNVENIILSKLTEQYAQFRLQPEAFVSDLAQALTDSLRKNNVLSDKTEEENEAQRRLSNMVIKFFELSLNKVIWYHKASDSAEGIWRSFVGISSGLHQLAVHKIISHMDDLDDMHWSLVHRFGSFLDWFGVTLPLAFYETVEDDLEHKAVFFLEVKEQDDGIKTKKEVLLEDLFSAKIKALAYIKRGIIS